MKPEKNPGGISKSSARAPSIVSKESCARSTKYFSEHSILNSKILEYLLQSQLGDTQTSHNNQLIIQIA